jgi:hypothetical protein
MSDDPQVQEELDPIALFPPEIQDAVTGLTYLGQLTEDVTFCGHTFGIRTLRPQHHMAIAQVLQPYRNTVQEIDVFRNLHVAMALTHVDNNQNFCPAIGPDLEGLVSGRLNFVSHHETGWYPPTLEFLWQRYVLLEAKATAAIKALDHLSQGSQQQQSLPWLDSLIGLGLSPDATSSGTPPSTDSN